MGGKTRKSQPLNIVTLYRLDYVISFKESLAEESQVNSHMTHLGDLIFLAGVNGTKQAVNYLRDMRNMFGHTAKNTYTVKWDGAPSIVCGIDPADGKFFVAKKGIFNKTPKVYKTQKDIDADLSGELADKFSILLKNLPSLGIRSGIFQGDLMYTKSDLDTVTIDGQEMLTFHPNTIVYAVPADSELAATIRQSELGMVFHTTYSGNSLDSLKASFGKNITDKFATSDKVWAIDATLSNDTKSFVLSDEDYLHTELLLKDIGLQFQRMPAALLNHISETPELRDLVLIYINSLVRQNITDLNPRETAEGFYKFIHARYQKEIDARKTEKSKSAISDKRINALKFFDAFDTAAIASLFELAKSFELLKDILLSKMRKVGGMSHFLRTKDGFKVTAPEGFVAISSTTGAAVKLVDRAVFSQSNFNPDVIKGWAK